LKQQLQQLVRNALEDMQDERRLSTNLLSAVQVSRTKDKQHGDFTSNIALVAAKTIGCAPRELAREIVQRLPASDAVDEVRVAGPGFINFYLRSNANLAVIGEILATGEEYGRSRLCAGQRIQVEFVSANPTGPLHVGHGRGAAFGASVADLLEAVGFDVQREYYVNDAGRQMDILALSVWLRYLALCGESLVFPCNAYRGDYVRDIAAALQREVGDKYRRAAHEVFAGIPPDVSQVGDREDHIDALIAQAKAQLGAADYRAVFAAGLDAILSDIREDLAQFGIEYDQWFSERSLADSGAVALTIRGLRDNGYTFEKDGALWFNAAAFGDEKDRVLVRENGQTTYFAADVAYHRDKYARGFERMLDVWGADHHGYAPRVKAALQALGLEPVKLDVLFVQFANLYRGGKKVQMSTRAGEFVTLRQLREEVGKDAARFFYVMRKSDQHLDFDLDLAKSQSVDNPVYYIQYAHARICSVLRQLEDKGMTYDRRSGLAHVESLIEPQERALLEVLARYAETVETAAFAREPHQLVHFLRGLANGFHTYYHAHQFLVEDEGLRNARLNLILATGRIIANGLGLLGVSAPTRM
jgi:arginyl-tRNA synthetase